MNAEQTPMEVVGIYYIVGISGDNRHMADYEEGYIVHYDHSSRFGWRCCASFPSITEAKEFALEKLMEKDSSKRPATREQLTHERIEK